MVDYTRRTKMNILSKIKLLMKAKGPAESLWGKFKEVKRGYKTVSFWLAVCSSAVSLIGALNGLIPATTAVIIITGLTFTYNILRGLEKVDEVGVRPVIQTTEFWVGILNSAANGIISLQSGGISAEWLTVAQTVIVFAVGAAQNIGSRQPDVK
jgi:hypothetical protein